LQLFAEKGQNFAQLQYGGERGASEDGEGEEILVSQRQMRCFGNLLKMTYDFHIHDVVRVEYRVTTDGPSFPRGFANIQNEIRVPGGSGVVAAVALARWGARVLLTGNPIGDDSHGKLLQTELANIPNLAYEPEVRADFETPYALLLQAGRYNIGSLLSAHASRVPIVKKPRDARTARYLLGDASAWGEEGTQVELSPATQDFPSLVGALEGAAGVYARLMLTEWTVEHQNLFVETVGTLYRNTFGGLETIPSLEEVEASLQTAPE
jgi:hypothetical protein